MLLDFTAVCLADTSVLIDLLRGHEPAASLLEHERRGPLHASEISRLEVLAGMKLNEEGSTRSLLAALIWHPVDESIAERGGKLGRQWLPSHGGIDTADLAIAATALRLGARMLTTNIKHFPMFPGLTAPY